jgi:hypothetical protein
MRIFLDILEMLILLDIDFTNREECLNIIKQIKRLDN